MFCGEMQCGRRLGLGPNPNFAVITGASKHTGCSTVSIRWRPFDTINICLTMSMLHLCSDLNRYITRIIFRRTLLWLGLGNTYHIVNKNLSVRASGCNFSQSLYWVRGITRRPAHTVNGSCKVAHNTVRWKPPFPVSIGSFLAWLYAPLLTLICI